MSCKPSVFHTGRRERLTNSRCQARYLRKAIKRAWEIIFTPLWSSLWIPIRAVISCWVSRCDTLPLGCITTIWVNQTTIHQSEVPIEFIGLGVVGDITRCKNEINRFFRVESVLDRINSSNHGLEGLRRHDLLSTVSTNKGNNSRHWVMWIGKAIHELDTRRRLRITDMKVRDVNEGEKWLRIATRRLA